CCRTPGSIRQVAEQSWWRPRSETTPSKSPFETTDSASPRMHFPGSSASSIAFRIQTVAGSQVQASAKPSAEEESKLTAAVWAPSRKDWDKALGFTSRCAQPNWKPDRATY